MIVTIKDLADDMTTQAKETILFVDDEESILDIARTFFGGQGYQVLTAGNGRQAVQVVQEKHIDCCFTDINMPEMDGMELAEYLHKFDNTIPVVIMTGYPSLDNTIHTIKNGVVDFLIKPVNLNQMKLCVQRVLRERRLFIENVMLQQEVQAKKKLVKLNRALEKKNRELSIVNRIMNDFGSLRESADVFKHLVDVAVQLIHADAACFYLINESTDEAIPIASAVSPEFAATSDTATDCVSRTDSVSLSGDCRVTRLLLDVVREDRPMLVAQNANGANFLPAEIRSFMVAPLKIRSKLLGVLSASVRRGDLRFSEKELFYLSFMCNKAASSMESLALYENIYNNLLATLYAFVKAIEARDPYTKQHSNRVTRISIAMAKAMHCTSEEQDILNVAGLLHDIGKIGIRDEILLKPGRLNREEFRVIQQHPVIGAEIMDNLGLWHREKQIVRGHHERFDGTGYPDGLKGEEIPLLARILSVADVYDAIASDRAYRERMEEEKILSIMYSGAGTQFDPEIIGVFRQLYESGDMVRITQETE